MTSILLLIFSGQREGFFLRVSGAHTAIPTELSLHTLWLTGAPFLGPLVRKRMLLSVLLLPKPTVHFYTGVKEEENEGKRQRTQYCIGCLLSFLILFIFSEFLGTPFCILCRGFSCKLWERGCVVSLFYFATHWYF